MHVDILSIHYRILDYLKDPGKENEEDEQKMKELQTQLRENHDIIATNIRDDIKNQIKMLENNVRDLADGSLFHFYLLKTQEIIEEYQKILHEPIVIDFMKCDEKVITNDNHYKRESLIRKYTHLIKKYFASFSFIHNICGQDILSDNNYAITDNYTKSLNDTSLSASNNNLSNTNIKCQKCGNQTSFESFDNQNVCGDCGIVLDQFNQQGIISFKDAERVNMNSKYTYDRKTHFKDCIYQFQGKQNVSIQKKVYDDILEQLISYTIIPPNYQDLPKEMAFEQVTKEHIFLFLKQTRHVKHYEDATLIYNVLTGKPIPDISYLEERLIRDFDMLVDQYDKKFRHNTERKNFINTQYILYQLLNRHHYICSKDDFNMLKTIDRRYYHDEICSILFEELGWNHKPIF